jgi:hypothetical protein
MMTVALIMLVSVAAIWLTAAVASQRFQSRISEEVAKLFSSATACVGPDQLAARRSTLPEPVLRYLAFAVSDRAPAIRTMRLTHGGFFRTKPNQAWQNIKGEEHFAVTTPGFVWNGSIHPAPMVSIVARDLLQSGRGTEITYVHLVMALAVRTVFHRENVAASVARGQTIISAPSAPRRCEPSGRLTSEQV